jgi:hypothetical protein
MEVVVASGVVVDAAAAVAVENAAAVVVVGADAASVDVVEVVVVSPRPTSFSVLLEPL